MSRANDDFYYTTMKTKKPQKYVKGFALFWSKRDQFFMKILQ